MTYRSAVATAERERDDIDAQRRAVRFAALGQPRPVAVVAAAPRPDWVAPVIAPAAVRTPRQRSAGPGRVRTVRPAAAPGKCSICGTRDVKPPRVLRGRANAGQVKTHKTCQPCIDERVEYKKRKRSRPPAP